MKNSVVVDTSVAIKWILQEPDADKADMLLLQWSNEEKVIYAPSLLIYELTNVLYKNVRKGEISLQRVQEALSEIVLLELELVLPQDLSLSKRAIELASQFNLPATYDAHFLALAEHKNCALWTADERLWNTVKSRLDWVHWLAQYPQAGQGE